MPISHHIDRDQRLVIATPNGVMTDADSFGYEQDVWPRPENSGYDEIFDLTDVTEIEFVSVDRVSEFADMASSIDRKSTRLNSSHG